MLPNNSCKVCGKFFESDVAAEYCPVCKKTDDIMYTAVRNFLLEKPRSSIFTVTSELKIPVKVIKRFLREDRLEIVESDNSFLKCDRCGKPISSGYYCRDCKPGGMGKINETPVHNEDNSHIEESLKIANEKKIKYL